MLTKEKRLDLFANAPVPKAIMSLVLPTLLSQLITMIYNVADSFFVGRLGDPYQVAALSLVFPLFMITHLIGNLFGLGANGVISRSLGAEQYEKAKATSAFAFYGAAAASLTVSILSFFFLPSMLKIAGASPSTVGYATDYLTYVLTLGAVPTVLQLIFSHIIRAEGNSRQAGFGIMLGGVLNIFLDPLFIFGLKMEVAGAALATLISNIVSLIYFFIVFYRLRKESFLSIRPADIRLNVAGEVLKNGLPAACQIILGSSSNLVMTHTAAGFSDIAVASFGILQKFTTMAVCIALGISQGVIPLLGFNYTAGNYPRIKSINRYIISAAMIFSLAFLTAVEMFPEAFVSVFIADQETIRTAAGFVRIGFAGVVGTVIVNFYIASFQAFGKWQSSLLLSCVRQLVIYIPLILIMSRLWGVNGLAGSYAAAELLAASFGALIYVRLIKSIKKELLAKQ